MAFLSKGHEMWKEALESILEERRIVSLVTITDTTRQKQEESPH